MIRVGFVLPISDTWTGGVHYYRNLLSAVSKIKNKKIQPVIFFGTSENNKTIKLFEQYGETIKTPLLNKRSPMGLLNLILLRMLNRSFVLEYLFRKYDIQLVSHSRFIASNRKLKTINWITDFQHIHFPEMFSWFECKYRDTLFKSFASSSDAIILSSKDALEDFKIRYRRNLKKAKVLHFVSEVDSKIYKISDTKNIEKKYNFRGRFFFLPNQLWKHKNHMVILKAVNALKKSGKNVLILCTGYIGDYRNSDYKTSVMKYLKDNKLEENIKFLGLIDYNDVLTLMRYCISIINPSLFEGWSTSVEEAKSVGKNIILSNLKVHKEQNPPKAVYFDPKNEKELASILWKKWRLGKIEPDYKLENIAKKDLQKRIIDFGNAYQDIVISVINQR